MNNVTNQFYTQDTNEAFDIIGFMSQTPLGITHLKDALKETRSQLIFEEHLVSSESSYNKDYSDVVIAAIPSGSAQEVQRHLENVSEGDWFGIFKKSIESKLTINDLVKDCSPCNVDLSHPVDLTCFIKKLF